MKTRAFADWRDRYRVDYCVRLWSGLCVTAGCYSTPRPDRVTCYRCFDRYRAAYIKRRRWMTESASPQFWVF